MTWRESAAHFPVDKPTVRIKCWGCGKVLRPSGESHSAEECQRLLAKSSSSSIHVVYTLSERSPEDSA